MPHRPGTWTVISTDTRADDHIAVIDDGKGYEFAWVQLPDLQDTIDTAMLIASAPDLLRELETAIVWIERSGELYAPTPDEILPQLRAAIAKARGNT